MYRRRYETTMASEIAAFLGRTLKGKDCPVDTVTSIDNLCDNALVFLTEVTNQKFGLREAKSIDLSAFGEHGDIVLIADPAVCANAPCTCIPSDNPRLDFARALDHFFARTPAPEIHATAIICEGAQIGTGVTIGAHCYIGPHVRIGDGTRVLHNVVITGEVTIGEHCVIKSNSTIGSEGFSFIFTEGELTHFPQVGGIHIGNHVWIGSNVCIECATLDVTRIEDHVKVDDLVQIGHNSVIGTASQITAGAVICGRVVIEHGCWIAPNAVIDNGVTVGHDSMVGTGAVVRKDVEPKSVVAGVPAKLLRKLD